MTASKIRIDSEGRLQTDAETLEILKNREFELQDNGHIVPLTPRPRRLHEIEDVGERTAAYEKFKKRVVRPGGENLPENWETIRDSIYD